MFQQIRIAEKDKYILKILASAFDEEMPALMHRLILDFLASHPEIKIDDLIPEEIRDKFDIK